LDLLAIRTTASRHSSPFIRVSYRDLIRPRISVRLAAFIAYQFA
jgi:hypothetical protein